MKNSSKKNTPAISTPAISTFPELMNIPAPAIILDRIRRVNHGVHTLTEKLRELEYLHAKSTAYIETVADEKRIADYIDFQAKFGVKMSRQDAIRLLDIKQSKPVPQGRGVRVSILNENETKIDNGLVIETLKTHKCSFSNLPKNVQLLFNPSTRSRYLAVSSYVSMIDCKGQGKQGYFALLLQQQTIVNVSVMLNNKTLPDTLTDDNGNTVLKPQTSTISRFKQAMACFE